MKAIKFIFSLLVIIGLQQKVYGGLNYRRFSPSIYGSLIKAPSTFASNKVRYSSMIQIVKNDEAGMILLKDYLALKAVDLCKSAQESFKGARQSTEPFFNGATAILGTLAAAFFS